MINIHRSTSVLLSVLIRSSLWIAFFQLVLISQAVAQSSATDTRTPPGLTPGSPAGSYALSGFDNINLYTGGLNFRLPLLQVGGRSGASYTMMLPIEQKWRVDHDYQFGQHWPNQNWWTGLRPGYGPGVLQGRQTHEGCGDGGPWPGGEVQTGSMTTLTFTAPDGTEYELRDELTGGNRLISTCCCYYQQHANGASRGTVFKTFDGTAATFISDVTIYDWSGGIESGPHIIEPTGYFILRDGTRYRIEWGKVMWIRDRNGNQLDFEYNSPYGVTRITDTMGRQVTVEYDVNDPQYGLCDRISFNGFGGAPRKIWVAKTTLGNALRTTQPYDITAPQTYAQLFLYLTGSSSTLHNPTGTISSVWLPDGRRYQLLYNTYSEVARVVLPTGGAVEYDWGEGGGGTICSQGPEIRRRVFERRVYHDGSTLEGKVTYEGSEAVSRDANGIALARSKHYFNGGASPDPCPSAISHSQWNEGKEYQTEDYTADGGTLLRRISQTWQQTTPSWHWSVWTAEASNNPKLVTTVTTVEPNGPNLVTKQTAINPQTGAIGFDQFNNQTDVWEYDYGTGAPSTHPVRHVHTDYLAINPVNSVDYTGTGVHIRSLPRAQQTYSVNPSTGVENLVAQSETKYDEMALSPWYGTVQSWVDPGMARGNPTKVRKWLNPGNSWIEARAQFDQVGNVTKSWDANNNQTEMTYSSTCQFAYPTQTTSAVPDPTGQYGSTTALVTTSAHDFSTGLVTSTTDANGQTTNILYIDVLDRPTAIIRPTGGGRTDFEYGDTIGNLFVRTLSDLDATRRTDAYQYFDGLGRGWRSARSEDATSIYADTQYDSKGRVWKVSNPYRAGETIRWTTTGYDGLSRVVSVTTPDSAVVTTSYSRNQVTVTDQMLKKRMSEIDALGRLTDVWEITAADSATEAVSFPGHSFTAGYRTKYAYDALDDLVTVTQRIGISGTTLTRSFAYDSLKRSTSATNPESGTIDYQYDNNGNLTRKTDGRGVFIDYVYDALNRNTTVNYSDTTSINPDITRAYDGAINGKGRFWYSYGGGNDSAGTTVEHTAIDNYDALGRPLIQRQLFKQNSNWGPTYQMSRAYNLAGGVDSQTYPSGRAASYSYDDAGRTSNMNGTLGDGVTRTYSTGIIYSPFGGMAKEQFGTDTPIYNKSFYNSRGQLSEIRVSDSYTGPMDTDWNRGAIINHYSDNCWGMCGQPGETMPDNNGNLKKQGVYIPGQTDWWQQYDYDNLNRLSAVREIGSQVLWQQTYVYDRYGNRRIDTGPTQTWGGINNLGSEVDTATNRLYSPGDLALPDASRRMRYDNAGNLSKDTYTGAGDRTYDAENRMTQAWANNQWQVYTYNADGQRVRRKVDGVETWQIYGFDGELLAEYQANGPTPSPQKEYGYRNGQLLIVAETSGGSAAAPSGLAAVPSGGGASVTLSWSAASGATNYRVERKGAGGSYGLAGTTSSTGLIDSGVSSGNAYLYKVCAADGSGNCLSAYSNIALGAAVNFPTDSTITTLVTPIKALHITELRLGVNAVRTLAGLPGASWTNPNVALGMTISVYDVRDLRDNLDEALILLGLQTSPYEDQTLAGAPNGTIIKRLHITQLRERATSGSGGAGGGSSQFNLQWLVTDQLGTSRMIFDKTGSLAGMKRHDYLPFGEELFAGTGGRTTGIGYSAIDNVRQKFTQKERDIETNLDYFINRYYSSTQGRFTSVDPVKLTPVRMQDPQRFNLYAYARNNPLKFIDPEGKDVFLANEDKEGRRRALLSATKNLTTAEQRNIGVRKNADGKFELYVKDANKINMDKASAGYTHLTNRISNHDLKIDFTLVPKGGSAPIDLGAGSNTRIQHSELARDAGGITVSSGDGNIAVFVAEGGRPGGVLGLTASGKETPIAFPEHIVTGHELFGETQKYVRGYEGLQQNVIDDNRVVIDIENQLRRFHGLPRRSYKGHIDLGDPVEVR